MRFLPKGQYVVVPGNATRCRVIHVSLRQAAPPSTGEGFLSGRQRGTQLRAESWQNHKRIVTTGPNGCTHCDLCTESRKGRATFDEQRSCRAITSGFCRVEQQRKRRRRLHRMEWGGRWLSSRAGFVSLNWSREGGSPRHTLDLLESSRMIAAELVQETDGRRAE